MNMHTNESNIGFADEPEKYELIKMGWIRFGTPINIDLCNTFGEGNVKVVFDEEQLQLRKFIHTNTATGSKMQALGNANSEQNQSAWSFGASANITAGFAGLCHGGLSAHLNMSENSCKATTTTTNKFLSYHYCIARLENYGEQEQEAYLNCTTSGFRNYIKHILELGKKIDDAKELLANNKYREKLKITLDVIMHSHETKGIPSLEKRNIVWWMDWIKNPTQTHPAHEKYIAEKDYWDKEIMAPLQTIVNTVYEDEGSEDDKPMDEVTNLPQAYNKFYNAYGTGCVTKLVLGGLAYVEANVKWSSSSQENKWDGGFTSSFGSAAWDASISTQATRQLVASATTGQYNCTFFVSPSGSPCNDAAGKLWSDLLKKSLSDIAQASWTAVFNEIKFKDPEINFKKADKEEKDVYKTMKAETADDCVKKAQLRQLDKSAGWEKYKKDEHSGWSKNEHPNQSDLKKYNAWVKKSLEKPAPKPDPKCGEEFSDNTVLMHDQIGNGPNIVGNSIIFSKVDNDRANENLSSSDPSPQTTVLAYGYTGYEKLFPKVFPKPLSSLITPTQCLGVKAALWLEQELTIILYLNYCSLFPSWIGIDYSPSTYVSSMLTHLKAASVNLLENYKQGKSITQEQLDATMADYKHRLENIDQNPQQLWYTVIYKFVCDNYAFIKSCPLGLIPIVKSDRQHEPDGPWVFFRFRKEVSTYSQAQIAYGWPSSITTPTAKTLMEFDPIRVYPIIHWRQNFNDGKPIFVYASQQALNVGDNIFESADSRNKVYNLIATATRKFIDKVDYKWVKNKWNNPFNMGWLTDFEFEKDRRECLESTRVERQAVGNYFKVVINGNHTPFFGYTGYPLKYEDQPQDEIFRWANRQNPMQCYYVMDPDGHHHNNHDDWPPKKCFDCELYLVPVDFSDVASLNKGVTGYPMFNQSSESALQQLATNMIKRDPADPDNPPPDKFHSGIQQFVKLLTA